MTSGDSGNAMVVIGEYSTDFEANVVKSLLESEGIPCALTGEFAKYSFRNDPVSVLVPEVDVARARDIIASQVADASESEPEEDVKESPSRSRNVLLLVIAVIVAIATVYYLFSWSMPQ